MGEPSTLTIILILGLSFGISVLCALAKSAQLAFSASKLEELLPNEQGRRRLVWFLANHAQAFIGISALNTLANITFLAGVLLSFSSQGIFHLYNLYIAFVVGFLPLAIFAKAAPEALSRLQPERMMAAILPFIYFVYVMFYWLTWPIYRLTKALEKCLGDSTYAASSETIEKEILEVVREGEKEGLLEETEKDMITAIIDLKDLRVTEIMSPRTDMFSLQLGTSMSEALVAIIKQGFSRIPIYLENRDDIVGILYAKDLLKYWEHENRSKLKIADIMRKPYFIPETKTVAALLQEFQKLKVHIAVILDEYGGTAGIVTVQDIIEEIVGEIADEYDETPIEPITYQGENVIEVDARVRVEEINEAFQVGIPLEDGYETIVGFLLSTLGRIPKKDESYRFKNLEFIVSDASERKINRVKLIKHQSD